MDNARHLAFRNRGGKAQYQETTTNTVEMKFVSCPQAETFEDESSDLTLPMESKINFFAQSI